MTDNQKWIDFFKWLEAQPTYIRDWTIGLNEFVYSDDEDHFAIGRFPDAITIYKPSTGGAAVTIEYKYGYPMIRIDQISMGYMNDGGFRGAEKRFVAVIKTLETDSLINTLKLRIGDLIKDYADRAKERENEYKKQRAASLRKELEELER